jgi:hypothetical protein
VVEPRTGDGEALDRLLGTIRASGCERLADVVDSSRTTIMSGNDCSDIVNGVVPHLCGRRCLWPVAERDVKPFGMCGTESRCCSVSVRASSGTVDVRIVWREAFLRHDLVPAIDAVVMAGNDRVERGLRIAVEKPWLRVTVEDGDFVPSESALGVTTILRHELNDRSAGTVVDRRNRAHVVAVEWLHLTANRQM